MISNKLSARLFGIFFLLAFISYGIGGVLVRSGHQNSNNFAELLNNKAQFLSGGILMAVFHTFFNIGLALIMFSVVKKVRRLPAYGYLSAALVSTLMLMTGAVLLLAVVPVAQLAAQGKSVELSFDAMILFGNKSNFLFYQLGMTVWGIGGILLSYLLYHSRIVPVFFAFWGYAGYSVFIAGTILEIFGYEAGLYFSVPGGLFEIVMSIWLIIKGFNKDVWEKMHPVRVTI